MEWIGRTMDYYAAIKKKGIRALPETWGLLAGMTELKNGNKSVILSHF